MTNRNMIWTLVVGVLLFAGCATAPRTLIREEGSKPAITVFGEWKEHWGTTGQTDVTYHDPYRVSQTSGGNVKVQILGRNQKISDERLEGTVLTFT